MKKLKPTILFISENFLPETNAAAARVFERGIYWKEWGYKVKYITSFPNRYMGKSHKGYSDKLFQNDTFLNWHQKWQTRLKLNKKPMELSLNLMRTTNPIVIPRNHKVEEALDAASIKDDLGPLFKLLQVLEKPYEDRSEIIAYQSPSISSEQYQTFCGT